MAFESCTHDPWMGSLYRDGFRGRRVLLLGESHYAGGGIKEGQGPQPGTREFTKDVIEKWALGDRPARYFTVAARLLGADANSGESRANFWNRVAFYNYVQEIVGNGARQRPTDEMWSGGLKPFCDVLDQLRPDVVVVLGRELWNHLPHEKSVMLGHIDNAAVEANAWTTPSGHSALLGMTNHPSWPGFSYKTWRPRVDLLFAAAQPSGLPAEGPVPPDQP